MPDWYSASDLANLCLPGLPSTVQGVNQRAAKDGWPEMVSRSGEPLARRRKGRGGGWEYHYRMLPDAAQQVLAQRGLVQAANQNFSDERPTGPSWAVFERLPEASKAAAQERLSAVHRLQQLKPTFGYKAALSMVAREADVSPRTVGYWWSSVKALPPSEWLPALAPKDKTPPPRVDIPREAWELLKSDWLRLEKPSFESCFYRLQAIAADHGWSLPSKKTIKRRLDELPEAVKVLSRDGAQALERLFPPMERDRSHFHALQAVNADGHKWDVFVRWEDGKIGRPMMLAIQDLYSNKILAWRVGRSESADLVRLTFGDVFRDYGIPELAWLDNGRGFASKWITGGTENRFRFKVREEDPVGVLTALGVKVHWTRPYSGQSKPIERAFRDLCDHVAKHPAFAGAYTGNRPDAKPENYGSKAVPISDFLKIVGMGISQHNARPNRRTRVCAGVRSFDQAFEESFATSLIRSTSPAHLHMCLLAAEKVTAQRDTGNILFLGNRYWSPFMTEYRGQKLVARFDPDNLWQPLQIYSLDGRHLGEAEPLELQGFNDVEAARTHARKRSAWKRAQKEMLEAERSMTNVDWAALLPDDYEEGNWPGETRKPAPRSFGGRQTAAAQLMADHPDDNFEFNTALERGLKRTGHLSLVDTLTDEEN